VIPDALINVLAIDFPPISHLIEWPSGPLGINKVVVLMWLSVLIVFGLMYAGSRKKALVPAGVQNLAESAVDFIHNGIILETIGPDGMGYAPLLFTMFTFIFALNIWEIVPFAQMPVNARIALPLLLAALVWFIYNIVGIAKQGFFGYFKNAMFPPGVPWPLYILVSPIELVQIIIVRPLSQSVRLFANMLAGHLLLTSFAIITASLWSLSLLVVIWPASFALLVALTAFEVLVSFLQAFIFTILTAVYIGGSMHPDH
jgi:F-type H+-transporting ATPase subunit a